MDATTAEPSVLTIFGATGDLSRRKLLPALYRNHVAGRLAPSMQILGVSRRQMSDDEFRVFATEALDKAGITGPDAHSFVARLHYTATPTSHIEEFRKLRERLESLRRAYQLPPNNCFYLSLPPRAFAPTIAGLGQVGLNEPATGGWTRLVVEKPFGRDLQTAQALNDTVHEFFDESQIYRIDHYLGKETVQNLLVFRLANAFVESSWNRERVDSVQITVGESLGVGTRAGYYDHSGALRDMFQNHIMQLVTLVAMEVPSSFSADAIRYEKLKVLKSIAPILPGDAVRARYGPGTIDGQSVPGYLDEDGVPADSQTETFLGLRLGVESWRWQGVPFYIRTGKRMPAKTTQIAIRFRGAPVRFFERMGCQQDTADVLTLSLQPNEGFSFHFDIKVPGNPLKLERVPLTFGYGDRFPGAMPDSYQTLLLDALQGDQTLFVHGDEVVESWRVCAPLIESPPPVDEYPAGTWGPTSAEHLAIPESELWQATHD
ncbi:MAG: glucose-6-phosphate dehydrogenase [Deltaproteobacteria bacterium]|nr:glucose-6-phosphate dehydrogenase [Deltaproteobacteria bacterium]